MEGQRPTNLQVLRKARALSNELDSSKPLPVQKGEELPSFQECFPWPSRVKGMPGGSQVGGPDHVSAMY